MNKEYLALIVGIFALFCLAYFTTDDVKYQNVIFVLSIGTFLAVGILFLMTGKLYNLLSRLIKANTLQDIGDVLEDTPKSSIKVIHPYVQKILKSFLSKELLAKGSCELAFKGWNIWAEIGKLGASLPVWKTCAEDAFHEVIKDFPRERLVEAGVRYVQIFPAGSATEGIVRIFKSYKERKGNKHWGDLLTDIEKSFIYQYDRNAKDLLDAKAACQEKLTNLICMVDV